MKKTLILALAALVAGASFNAAQAEKKKKKKETVAEAAAQPQPYAIVSGSDSLSYAAGMMLTNGLQAYLQQQFNVDTAYMADFVRGFSEAVAAAGDPRQTAFLAGQQVASQVKTSMLPRMKADFTNTPDSIVDQALFRGFTDALAGETTVMDAAHCEEYFTAKQQYNKRVQIERQSQEGRDFLARNARQPGVITTPSGLQYKVLVQGDGEVPQLTDKVKVHYEGRLTDGTVFDSSLQRGEPATFRPDQVITGWTEALTMMPVGSKWQLFIPQELGYGERGAGHIPPYSTLIFEVELLDIEK